MAQSRRDAQLAEARELDRMSTVLVNAGYNFVTGGATDNWVIMDTSNQISWRISLIIGSGYINNFISIERLY